uniref:NADH-ubiquinone oxidoreductase chain 2 n=1 Tax=Lissodema cursor TaxID=1586495 RepID=A0A343C349_9CUCU|nr:NADH dehydrogenase subunit 2 [Lissodema cursor]
MIFFNTLILGTLISISSYSWMSMWMGLEINLLSMIPLMYYSNNMFSSESTMKYFITQTLASLVILFSIIYMLMITEFITPWMNSSMLLIMNSALLTKLGAAPFHFWLPEVMEGMNWFNCLIMLTWQKIAPMILLMNFNFNLKFIIIIITLSLLISSILNLNQTSLRKILTYSSINHIGWMLSSMLISYSIWLIYLMIYIFINLNITIMFYYMNCFYMNQIFNFLNHNKLTKMMFLLNFLSLSGLPPTIGFFSKWLVINWLILNNHIMLTLIMILMTLIMIFTYIRIFMSSIILNFNESKLIFKKWNNKFLILTNSFTMLNLISLTLLFNF